MTLTEWGKISAFSLRSKERRPALSLADVAVGLGVLTLLYGIARVGAQSLVRFNPPEVLPSVSLDPWSLTDGKTSRTGTRCVP